MEAGREDQSGKGEASMRERKGRQGKVGVPSGEGGRASQGDAALPDTQHSVVYASEVAQRE